MSPTPTPVPDRHICKVLEAARRAPTPLGECRSVDIRVNADGRAAPLREPPENICSVPSRLHRGDDVTEGAGAASQIHRDRRRRCRWPREASLSAARNRAPLRSWRASPRCRSSADEPAPGCPGVRFRGCRRISIPRARRLPTAAARASSIRIYGDRRPVNGLGGVAAQEQDHARDVLRFGPLREVGVRHVSAVGLGVEDARERWS